MEQDQNDSHESIGDSVGTRNSWWVARGDDLFGPSKGNKMSLRTAWQAVNIFDIIALVIVVSICAPLVAIAIAIVISAFKGTL